VQTASLLRWGGNIYSQRGDDGIIREILRRLEVRRGFFIEFGAWDGIYLSNTRLLFEEGWNGLYIEGDATKYRDLRRNYRQYPGILCANGFVTPQRCGWGKTLDEYCDDMNLNDPIDFLSIDIDGLDLNVFESLRRRPTVVCVEGGFSWHPQMKLRVPDEVAAQNLQQPLAVAVESLRAKGYEPICFNQNLYAVEACHAEKFGDIKRDALSLWLDAWYDQSTQFRKALIDFRRNHALIQRCETCVAETVTVELTA
jgi:hypothetical protein